MINGSQVILGKLFSVFIKRVLFFADLTFFIVICLDFLRFPAGLNA